MRESAYSLIELMVVLAIVAVLVVVGVASLGSPSSPAVRGLLDELEGVIMGAQKMAMAKGSDVYLVAGGNWTTGNQNFVLAFDTPRVIGGVLESPKTAADRIVTYARTTNSTTLDDHGQPLVPPGIYALQVGVNGVISREQQQAGVVVGASNWYTIALGNTPDLSTVQPGNIEPFHTALSLGNGLCQSDVNTYVIISGINKRFTNSFNIKVVGLRSSNPVANGPVGVIIVPTNSASVYKFMTSGLTGGNVWRRE